MANAQPSKQLSIETLEPRILLSATWTDGDTGAPIAGPTGGNDVFDGGSGNVDDVANALGGDDIMSGGGGEDTLSGGAGNDTIDGGNHDDTLYGNAGDDTLDGGKHDDALDGGAGDDTLIGGHGNDALDGGTDTDTADYSGATGGVNVDLSAGTATGEGNDTLTNIENVTGSANNDTLTGDGGNNVLDGGAGDDTIAGGTGDDTLQGGDGDDQLDGGDGTDTADYSDATAAVTVDLNAGTATGGAGNDTLTNIENVTGSANDDTLTDDAGSNVLDAGAGDDMVHYTGGSDTISGQDGNDTVVIHSGQNGDVVNVDGGSGIDAIDLTAFDANDVNDSGSQINVDLGGGDSFTINYTNVENILLAGQANQGPDAVDDSYNTTEDNAVTTGNVLGNDTDPENDALSITGFTQGSNGTVVNNNDGTFTYTPDADFSGTDTFDYTIEDGNGGSDTATVTVNVTGVNDGPDAVDDSYNTTEENAVTTGNVLGNDTDPENDALSITGFTQGSNGTVVNNNDGTFTYTPDADFSGTDTFDYTIEDGNGGSDTATVTVNVAQANNQPGGGQGSQPPPVASNSPDTNEEVVETENQSNDQPDEPVEDHQPPADVDETGPDGSEPLSMDDAETITLSPEPESEAEDLVQVVDGNDVDMPDYDDRFDRDHEDFKADQAARGANDPDIFDMIMRGGKGAVPEFGDDHVASAFESDSSTDDVNATGESQWDPTDIEIVELEPENPLVQSQESESEFTDRFENADDFHLSDWNAGDGDASGREMSEEAVATLPENANVELEQSPAANSEQSIDHQAEILQGLFPKVWAALAGIVGASHGPKHKDSSADDQVTHRHRRR